MVKEQKLIQLKLAGDDARNEQVFHSLLDGDVVEAAYGVAEALANAGLMSESAVREAVQQYQAQSLQATTAVTG